jgi:hypothetical protein
MRLVRKKGDDLWSQWDPETDDPMDADVETMDVEPVEDAYPVEADIEVDDSSVNNLKVVLHRWLPIGERDVAIMEVGPSTTVQEIWQWHDRQCAGDTVCLRLEIVPVSQRGVDA